MSSFHDPRTAITIADQARSDQIRRVADHRRYMDATRGETSGTDGGERRWPRATRFRRMSAGRRAQISSAEATTSAP
jgi:hypothetical protein